MNPYARNNPYSKFKNVLKPRRNQAQEQIQNSTSYDEDDAIDEDERIEAQFNDPFSLSTTSALTAAERQADSQGGAFFDMHKYIQAMQDIDNAPRPQMDALTKHLSGQPKRQDHKMGKLGTLGASLAGAATGYAEGPSRGIAAGLNFMDRPYDEARQDWMDKSGPLQHAAQLESADFGRKSAGINRAMTAGASMSRAKTLQDNSALAKKVAEAKLKRDEAIHGKNMENLTSQIWQRKYGVEGVVEDDQGYMLLRTNSGLEPTGIRAFDWKKHQETIANNAATRRTADRNADTAAGNLQQRITEAKIAEDNKILDRDIKQIETDEDNRRAREAERVANERLKIEQGNAGTARGNLEARKTEEANRERERGKVGVNEQTGAAQQALKYLYPFYSEFMTQSPTGEHVLNAPSIDADDAEAIMKYREFLARYQNYIERITKGKQGMKPTDIELPKIPRVRN